MVAENYAPSLARLLVHEGGFSNHPKDPGRATMKGVTQLVYDAFRTRKGKPVRTVRRIETAELEEIYATQYAKPIRFERLPIGLDYVVFDGAANSGPVQSVKWLQRALADLGLYLGKIDGLVGNGTLSAVDQVNDVDALIGRICDIRKAFLRALKTFSTFGRVWMSRVDQVGDAGQDWATGSVPADTNLTYVSGMERRALVEDANLSTAPVIGPTVGAGGGGLAYALEQARQQIAPYAGTLQLVDHVLAGLMIGSAAVAIGGVVYGLVSAWRRKRVSVALDLDLPAAA